MAEYGQTAIINLLHYDVDDILYFCKMENCVYGEIKERTISYPTPVSGIYFGT